MMTAFGGRMADRGMSGGAFWLEAELACEDAIVE